MQKLSGANRKSLIAVSLTLLAFTIFLVVGGKRLGTVGSLLVFGVLVVCAVVFGALFRRGSIFGKKTRARIGLVIVLSTGVPVIASSLHRLTVSFDFFAVAAIGVFAWLIVQLVLDIRRAA